MIRVMAGGRNSDDVIRRVHQRAEEQAGPRLPEPSPEPIYEWFAATYGLLTDIRRNLPPSSPLPNGCLNLSFCPETDWLATAVKREAERDLSPAQAGD
jgi:hypothetical protein